MCASRIPSTSSQTGFMAQWPQSSGMPSRMWVSVLVIASTCFAFWTSVLSSGGSTAKIRRTWRTPGSSRYFFR